MAEITEQGDIQSQEVSPVDAPLVVGKTPEQVAIQRSLAHRAKEGKASLKKFIMSLPREQFDALLESGADYGDVDPTERALIDHMINAAEHDKQSKQDHSEREQHEKREYDLLLARTKFPPSEIIPTNPEEVRKFAPVTLMTRMKQVPGKIMNAAMRFIGMGA